MYVNFPKSFADEIKGKLDETQAAIKESLVYGKPLTVEQWSTLNSILVMVKVGLRTEEEHAAAMKRHEVKA